jgi:hypothetical protein
VLTVQWVQQEEAHCGPATIKMLFSFHGVALEQTDISQAAGMADVIHMAPGMRLDEINDGVTALFPNGDYALLAKYQATIHDIEELTEGLGMPIGVEWQGKFPNSNGGHYDQGHYSVIVGVDARRRRLQIVDPEPTNLLTKDGELTFETFVDRWWEVDVVPLPHDLSVSKVIEMEHLILVVVPKAQVETLRARGFRPATRSLIWDCCTPLEP